MEKCDVKPFLLKLQAVERSSKLSKFLEAFFFLLAAKQASLFIFEGASFKI